ncbi:helix-turn-helix domain-containing protein [Nocardia higoensis]|uniref:Helix-turn-helix domain-containing protein n=1 Tax=Nocardia higoensis TaxID=228599 RepID=A0ABS0DI44_9NOCA|nr:helix-turn-helix domain-containing protein [Nocardia higoensis]MBF6358084.1 helix-turn-helix domain-containing protein [Nocardia higoensis]
MDGADIASERWTNYLEMLMYTNSIDSLSELARRLGVSPSTPSVWMKRRLKPRLEIARRIAEEFDRPLTEVMVNAELATPEEFGDMQVVVKPLELSNDELHRLLGERLGVTKPPLKAVEPEDTTEEKKPAPRRRRKASGE